jgi:septal ring factor EnvC (AmiA/AmiB activator)
MTTPYAEPTNRATPVNPSQTGTHTDPAPEPRSARDRLVGPALAGVLACALAACQQGVSEEEHQAALAEVTAKFQAELQDLRDDQETEKTKLLQQVEEAAGEVTGMEAKLKTMEAELEAAKKESEATRSEFDAYKKQYRVSIRERAKGREYPQIAKLDGTVFKGITLSKLDPVEVRFLHSEGIGSLALSELTPEFATEFGFDEGEALAFIESKKRPADEGAGGAVAFEQDSESEVDYNLEMKKLAEKRQQDSEIVARLGERLAYVRNTIGELQEEAATIRRLGKGAFVKNSSKDPADQIRILQEKIAAQKTLYASLYQQYLDAK